jgi:hypothetical protein
MARRRRSLGAVGGSSTKWLIGAGALALTAAGFWYFRSRASASSRAALNPNGPTALPPPAAAADPLTPMSPDQARQIYKASMLHHALGIATLKLALLRDFYLQNPVTAGGDKYAEMQEKMRNAEGMVRELAVALGRVQGGGSLTLSETTDLIAYLEANRA